MQLSTLSGIAGLVAALLYLIGTFYQSRTVGLAGRSGATRNIPPAGSAGQSVRKPGSGQLASAPQLHSNRVFLVGLAAVLAHAVSVWGVISDASGFHLGITQVSTLIAMSVSLLVLLSSLRKPLDNLILALFPLAILAIIISLTVPSPRPPLNIGVGIASHILLSILAFSFFTIAAVQAGLLAFQNYQLRHRHASTVIRRFAPLQVMESLLFELLWAGQILLSLGIVAGFLFIEDLRAEGLLHKMFFSVLAWCVFTVLLAGRHRLGWRGPTAIRWTLTGFVFLILGYYGSRIVLAYVVN